MARKCYRPLGLAAVRSYHRWQPCGFMRHEHAVSSLVEGLTQSCSTHTWELSDQIRFHLSCRDAREVSI